MQQSASVVQFDPVVPHEPGGGDSRHILAVPPFTEMQDRPVQQSVVAAQVAPRGLQAFDPPQRRMPDESGAQVKPLQH